MDYTSLMKGIKKNISEIAHNIANSQFRYDVLPGKEQIIKETQERLSKTQDVYTALRKAQNHLIDTMVTATGDTDYSGGIRRAIRSDKDIDAAVDAQLRVLKNRKIDSDILNDKTVNTFKKNMHDNYAQDIRSAQINPTTGEEIYSYLNVVDKAGQLAQTYFKNSDERVRNNRFIGAIGAYGAISTGARLMSGGTISTDRYGRENLVGIPFL